MKATYVFKGFIDPRRPDVMKVNFSIEADAVKTSNTLGGGGSVIQEKYYKHVKNNIPFFGREIWIEIDGKIFNRISGNGPEPPYSTPNGEIVELETNFQE